MDPKPVVISLLVLIFFVSYVQKKIFFVSFFFLFPNFPVLYQTQTQTLVSLCNKFPVGALAPPVSSKKMVCLAPVWDFSCCYIHLHRYDVILDSSCLCCTQTNYETPCSSLCSNRITGSYGNQGSATSPPPNRYSTNCRREQNWTRQMGETKIPQCGQSTTASIRPAAAGRLQPRRVSSREPEPATPGNRGRSPAPQPWAATVQ